MVFDNIQLKMLIPVTNALGGLILLLAGFPSMAADNTLQEKQSTYDFQLKKYQQTKIEQESIATDIEVSESNLNELEKEKYSSQTALRAIQRIDRENPGLGLAEKVHNARIRNQIAFKNYQAELDHLQALRMKKIQAARAAQNEIIVLYNIAHDIKQMRHALITREVEKRIAHFKKTTVVDGYGKVTCHSEESIQQCQERAKRNAERDASEKGSIMVVNSVSNIRNFQLTQDQIETETQAQLSNVEILDKGWIGDMSYQYHIRATVTPVIGVLLRKQIEESVAQDLGFVATNDTNFDDSNPDTNNSDTITYPSYQESSRAQLSFDELDREANNDTTDIEEEEETQRRQFGLSITSNIDRTVFPGHPGLRRSAKTWYAMWGIGVGSASYPGNIQSRFSASSDAGGNRLSFAPSSLGFYWPLSHSSMAGFVYSFFFDYANNQASNQSFIVAQQLYALSYLKFSSGEIGRGFYFRGDLGVANVSRKYDTSLGSGFSQSENGAGVRGEIGYGFPVFHDSRILYALNYSSKSFNSGRYSASVLSVYLLW